MSSQSEHAQAELARLASDSAELKVGIGQQLQVHFQTVLEKVSVQNETSQQLHEAVKSVEQKQEAVQNEQAQALKAVKVLLAVLQTEQKKGTSNNRLTTAVVAALALVSLGWQVAQHFALM